MANLNKVFLIGNLTRDPELRYTPGGTAVANLGIAVNRRFKDSSGELKEEVCFLTVTVWDKQAEACCQYLTKGRPVFVEGVLQSRFWETSDGQKRSAIDVRAERVQFLGSYGEGSKDKDINKEELVGAPDLIGLSEAIKPEDIAWDE
ncbi:MAG: single-stranded DNA-binding protein [Candidatus Omnitrophica bacterium]|nr:single-stranded DNA-binding protein [Candidatus Omnitrophota bacterium]MBU1996464.1 single-stranded DNA-binding protein [Candidatus Omnitrophota bacterium]MBU4333876.1 single-stranded DNA-binding protein [Candidatus Omnitrophota bacterium]